mmetsp:Transcript_8229/g.17989  ORF Transcript_8229/g.17989 Transcript_8229/m.17989 type:complete len:101 (-) Transcript_8229:242-544(-)
MCRFKRREPSSWQIQLPAPRAWSSTKEQRPSLKTETRPCRGRSSSQTCAMNTRVLRVRACASMHWWLSDRNAAEPTHTCVQSRKACVQNSASMQTEAAKR